MADQSVSDETLNRCISEIRSKFRNTFKAQNVITTVPKKGYKWSGIKMSEPNKPPEKWLYKFLKILAFTFFVGVLMYFFALSLVKKLNKSEYTVLFLAPIESVVVGADDIEAQLKSNLRSAILETERFRFLANSLSGNQSLLEINRTNPLRLRWGIEFYLIQNENNVDIVLSLVNIESAVEVYRKKYLQSQLNHIGADFFGELEKLEYIK